MSNDLSTAVTHYPAPIRASEDVLAGLLARAFAVMTTRWPNLADSIERRRECNRAAQIAALAEGCIEDTFGIPGSMFWDFDFDAQATIKRSTGAGSLSAREILELYRDPAERALFDEKLQSAIAAYESAMCRFEKLKWRAS